MTSRTSPTSSGSRAEVASSNSITRGLHGQGPGDRDPLLLAARELARVASALCSSPTRVSWSIARSIASLVGSSSTLLERHRDVLADGLVREQVVRLEHDPDVRPHLVEVRADVGDVVAPEPDAAPRSGPRAGSRTEAASTCPTPEGPTTTSTSPLGMRQVDPLQDVVGSRTTCGVPRCATIGRRRSAAAAGLGDRSVRCRSVHGYPPIPTVTPTSPLRRRRSA